MPSITGDAPLVSAFDNTGGFVTSPKTTTAFSVTAGKTYLVVVSGSNWSAGETTSVAAAGGGVLSWSAVGAHTSAVSNTTWFMAAWVATAASSNASEQIVLTESVTAAWHFVSYRVYEINNYGGIGTVVDTPDTGATGTQPSTSISTATGSTILACFIEDTAGSGLNGATTQLYKDAAVAWDARTGAVSSSPTTVSITGNTNTWVIKAIELQVAYTLSESAPADVLLDVYGPVRFVQRTAFQPDAFQENAYQILGGPSGASGNTYNEGDTSSALAQDRLLAAQGFAQPDTHSALAQDQLVAALGWNAVISEASLAQDLLNGAQGAPGSLSELVTAAEQLATAAGFTAFLSESTLAQEQLNTAQGMLAAFADSARAQDVALPALQMPVGMEEVALADVLFDSTLLRPGTGSQYDESLIEACAARDALAQALGAGGGVEAKIGGAGATAGTSIFVFDD